jgi:hypothetical protein
MFAENFFRRQQACDYHCNTVSKPKNDIMRIT